MEPSVMAAARTPKPPLSSKAVRITKHVAICNCCAVEAAYSLGTTTLWCPERLESSTQTQWLDTVHQSHSRKPNFPAILYHDTKFQSGFTMIYHDLSTIFKAQGPKVSISCHSFSASKAPQKRDHPHRKIPQRPRLRLPMGDLASAVARDSESFWWLQYGAMSIGKQTKSWIQRKMTRMKKVWGRRFTQMWCKLPSVGFSNFVVRFKYLRFLYDGILWRRAICYPLATSSATVTLRPAFSLDAMPRANSWTVSWSNVCVVGRGFCRAGSSQGKCCVLMGIGARTRHSCHKIHQKYWNYWLKVLTLCGQIHATRWFDGMDDHDMLQTLPDNYVVARDIS